MKKRWIGALALAVSAALLGGCGKNGGNVEGMESMESGASGGDAQSYVTLGEYKGLEVTAVQAEYDDTEVELQTKQYYFTYVPAEDGITDRPVELLDMTNIDYEGRKDGVAFEGGTAQGANLLIGSGQFIDGFEEGLIGVMPGETVDLNLTFPEAYGNSELAGQAVVFTVTVNFIPEMEDERVEELGIADVTTVEELRTYVRTSLESQARSEYLTAVEDEVMGQIIQSAVFEELPEEMLSENRRTYSEWLDQMAANYGMTAKDYVEMYGMDYESTLDQYAEQYTKGLLVVRAIADQEGLNLSDEELDARMEEYAQSAGTTVDNLLVNGLTREDYRESFLYEDVVNFVVENSVSAAAGSTAE